MPLSNPPAGVDISGKLDASLKTSAAEIRAGANDTKYATAKALADAMPFVAFTPSAIDLSSFINGKTSLAAAATFAAPTNAIPGATGTLRITPNSFGCSWNTFWNFGPKGPPTLSTGAGVVDRVYYQIDDAGTSADCTFKAGA